MLDYQLLDIQMAGIDTNSAVAHPVFIKLLLSLSLPVTAFVNVTWFRRYLGVSVGRMIFFRSFFF